MSTYKTISCSVTGYQKKLEGLPCEDAIKVVHTATATIVAVADGHGDRRCVFASIGARLATKAACEVLKAYLRKVPPNAVVYWNSLRREIAIRISKAFTNLVLSDYRFRCKDQITEHEALELRNHITELLSDDQKEMSPEAVREKYIKKNKLDKELSKILLLYGTTVRATVLTDSYLFNCGLGDGDTIAVINGNVEWLLPKSVAYECETASLCEPIEDVVDSFAFSFVECKNTTKVKDAVSDNSAVISTLILATDGFRNSFYSYSMFEKKVKAIADAAHSQEYFLKRAKLKKLYEKLSTESVFQDDISTVFAIRTGHNNCLYNVPCGEKQGKGKY